ncbi:hypothetical protein J4E85_004467 [Alternaria conjuncta]|uniref:uncharacterized protein n=1 Tax=Alternaria conjuncta TaxID=181017 RepID=UPI002220DE14|nr:uncharacterized protein J4E85_004467 [Alternaria conjuncta]KAI4929846.1 hypothetical protein J4E85_004467 [Alternaria conjuncta]
MSVSLATVQYFDNANSLSYAVTPCIQHYPLSPKSGSMFGKLKKTFSTRKTSKSTNSYSPRDTEGAGQMLGNAPTGAPVNKRNSASRDSGLAPFSYPGPFDSASPATRRPTQNAPAVHPTPTTDIEEDDPYDFLRTFDTVFLIDDSGSMAGRSWKETGKALEVIAPICTKRDADGIDIYFLNHPDSSIYKNVTSASTVIEIFQTVRPRGATPTGQRLNKILKSYLERFMLDKSIKPLNIIVITDGVPSDDLETPIINAARKLDYEDAIPHQLGIQFFQVGKEPGAREHLMQLDDGLIGMAQSQGLGVPRDIVDTVPFTGDGNAELTGTGILKATMGAINRRWDFTSKGIHQK